MQVTIAGIACPSSYIYYIICMYNCIYSIYNVYCTKQNIVTYVNQELERFLGIYEELVWHKEGQMLLFASLPFVGQLLTITLQMISMLVNTEFSETGDSIVKH